MGIDGDGLVLFPAIEFQCDLLEDAHRTTQRLRNPSQVSVSSNVLQPA